ncbi:HlyD family efflux transporter periplasmic adaptor subunit [Sphingomonas sp. KR3-1]|uniref:HlyD family secretion protein n=1 Tax=Sphingomonas sp. KR3-1 TaxID=3156611 RepID=UPI0032B486D2
MGIPFLSASHALFREEAVKYRADRLHGEVNIAVPLSWQAIGFLIIVALGIALAFLATASYARVATVSGAITLDTGMATIVPSRAGIVAAVRVREGQRVAANAPLLDIRAEESQSNGATAPERIRDALGVQDQRLSRQGEFILQAADAERAQLAAQATGLAGELQSLEAQLADQQRLVASARTDFESARQIADRGYISRRDLDTREAALLSRQQQLSQLEQLRASKRSDLLKTQRAIAQSAAQAEAQMAGNQSNRAELLQQIAQADVARGYQLTAPIGGTVSALTARLGQPAALQQSLMTIVPDGAQTRVELYVPTAAAGFLAPGQEVRLAVDAFPYQQFGTITGKISEIAGAPISRQGPNGPTPFYLVTVQLAHPWVRAFGRQQPLLPGMTLTARIVTERRSLIQWLFEPLFAVRNR